MNIEIIKSIKRKDKYSNFEWIKIHENKKIEEEYVKINIETPITETININNQIENSIRIKNAIKQLKLNYANNNRNNMDDLILYLKLTPYQEIFRQLKEQNGMPNLKGSYFKDSYFKELLELFEIYNIREEKPDDFDIFKNENYEEISEIFLKN